MHVDPLSLLGQDEAEFLLLVEPKHRVVHGFALVLEKVGSEFAPPASDTSGRSGARPSR